ncbi:hypothetical protein GCK72_019300 [Caenorhabditis remanei]|uniref:Uncharacterized protein n=1 Tax=Caenorhabditis remanei TaxID=31234 RepID=A0A6A5GDL1_CAERE|nr:hypothetical protein GCK72_019300 [Caenorhabditis remanei]KAF1752745.1 hypothetical protein GCK72_019300 [Caenorhabditis remanei]
MEVAWICRYSKLRQLQLWQNMTEKSVDNREINPQVVLESFFAQQLDNRRDERRDSVCRFSSILVEPSTEHVLKYKIKRCLFFASMMNKIWKTDPSVRTHFSNPPVDRPREHLNPLQIEQPNETFWLVVDKESSLAAINSEIP